MNLIERRKKLVENTLNDVIRSFEEICKLKSIDRKLEFSFKLGISPNDSFLSLGVSGGNVISGLLKIKSNGIIISHYQINSFPLLFLHQISILSDSLLKEIKYISLNYSRFNLNILESFITKSNQILTILNDPKFTDIDISNYINDIPKNSNILLIFRDGNCSIKIKSFQNINDLIADNFEDSSFLMALESLIKRIIQNLKYLQCDVKTWNL